MVCRCKSPPPRLVAVVSVERSMAAFGFRIADSESVVRNPDALIEVDADADAETLDALRSLPEILSVRVIELV